MSRKLTSLPMAVVVLVLDQFTKSLAAEAISPASSIKALPFLYLVNVRNTGAAFGMLQGLGNAYFIGLSVAAIVFIAVLLFKGTEDRFALSLILSGAIGNLIDRILLGYVRDFIDFTVGGYHWPAFNVADSALTVGLIVMLFGSVFGKGGSRRS